MINRFHNVFKRSSGCSMAVLSVTFLLGALFSAALLRRGGAELCGKAAEQYAYIGSALLLLAAVSGSSLFGVILLPLLSAALGVETCLCSAYFKLSGAVPERRTVLVFAVLIPLFFSVSAKGAALSHTLIRLSAAHSLRGGARSYITLCCICAAAAAAMLYYFSL